MNWLHTVLEVLLGSKKEKETTVSLKKKDTGALTWAAYPGSRNWRRNQGLISAEQAKKVVTVLEQAAQTGGLYVTLHGEFININKWTVPKDGVGKITINQLNDMIVEGLKSP